MSNKKNVLFVPEKLENKLIFSMTAWVGSDPDNMSRFTDKLLPVGTSIIKEEIIPTKKKKHSGKEECKLHKRIFVNGEGWLVKINFKPDKILHITDMMKQILGDGYDVQLLPKKEEEKVAV